jgi:Dyp-type peroxidase family
VNWKATGVSDVFASLLLSFEGYWALGLPDDRIPSEDNHRYFSLGMKHQRDDPNERQFNDPPVESWEGEYRGPIHALVILADNDRARLGRDSAALLARIAPWVAAVWSELGRQQEFRFPKGRVTIEHFGFEDGISNPLMTVPEIDEERQKRGWDQWDPAAPLKLVLRSDPGAPGEFGSFFVFRKLEQDVAGFRGALRDLATPLALTGPDAEKAGAMAVGRYRDGTPILSTVTSPSGTEANNFNFKIADPEGRLCPFHAHIRKTNPRGDTVLSSDKERDLRIARRGITYGERPDLDPGSQLPPPLTGVGLLFMSYQAKLDQFAIQQEGSGSNDFVNAGVGVDAVIGQNPAPKPQEWPAGSGKRFTMANFVTFKGGEYFFAPSMEFLRGL